MINHDHYHLHKCIICRRQEALIGSWPVTVEFSVDDLFQYEWLCGRHRLIVNEWVEMYGHKIPKGMFDE